MSAPDIHITRWGTSGPPVVLVHGSAQGSRVGGDGHFAAQQRLAERGWQVLVPDRPGHGRSPAPGRPDDADLDAVWLAEMLAELPRELPGEGAHLVGHSFGGCVALAAAARRPQSVRSLTLIEPGMQKLATHDPRVRRFGMQLLAVKYLSLSAASRARRFAQLVGIPPEIGASKSTDELTRMGQGIFALRVPSADTLARQLLALKQAAIPLLVVSGGWNPAFEATADAVAAAGNGQRRVIASPHHFPQSVSDEFNQVLAAFMVQSDSARADRASAGPA